ncbi:ANTAR domain-containing protein [Streptomyces sp. NPDC050560]|uniref:ANTAR domain-containing protein n=1 Tax=Streptomyces sp. NPDC050560 TaxID=3365630 RepID=UPI0037943096
MTTQPVCDVKGPCSPGDAPSCTTCLALLDKVAQLEQAVVSHATIDQAIGVLVALGGVSPEDGWDVLREVSMHTNTKVRKVASLVVEGAADGEFDEHIRPMLHRGLAASQRER